MSTQKPDDLDALRTILDALGPFDQSDKERIIRWTMEKLGLDAPKHSSTQSSATSAQNATQNILGSQDIKSFITLKAPQSDNQLAAVVAYFHKFESPVKKDTINKDDLLNACRLAGKERPKRPEQTLLNAHQMGLLDKGADRGSYEINSVGENLVAVTLPSSGTNSTGRRKARPTKKTKSKKSK
jgi:hypothetical protein